MYKELLSEHYRKLSEKERRDYIRTVRLRRYAKINGFLVNKVHLKDRYHIYNDSGYHKVFTLDEAENWLADIKRQN